MSDLISRQAAMDEMSKQQTYKMFVGEDTVYLDANDVGSVLASLPSVQPERKKGKWERHYTRQNVYAGLGWHCSLCGYKNADNYLNVYYNYCPNCGADMRGEQDVKIR